MNSNPLQPFLDPRWPARWSARERMVDAVTPHLLDALDPRAGERVLDIGIGTGAIAFAAAAGAGTVLGIDVSEPMIAFCLARARERGITNAAFLVADAASALIPGAPFDAATSQFGVMFFPDPIAALANIHRHLRPAGRFVFACWAEAEDNPLHPNVLTAPFEADPPWPLEGNAPGPFSLADSHHTRYLLESAGFREIRRRRIDLRITVPASAVFDEAMLDDPGPSQQSHDSAIAAIRAQLQGYAAEGGIRVPLAFQLYSAAAAVAS